VLFQLVKENRILTAQVEKITLWQMTLLPALFGLGKKEFGSKQGQLKSGKLY